MPAHGAVDLAVPCHRSGRAIVKTAEAAVAATAAPQFPGCSLDRRKHPLRKVPITQLRRSSGPVTTPVSPRVALRVAASYPCRENRNLLLDVQASLASAAQMSKCDASLE